MHGLSATWGIRVGYIICCLEEEDDYCLLVNM